MMRNKYSQIVVNIISKNKKLKKNILTILFLLTIIIINAQSDSINTIPPPPKLPNAKFAVYNYDSLLQTNILTYQYWGLWDFDNDGIKDSLSFVSNGGAHAYYYLKILLSSKKEWTIYPTFQTDMPFLNTENTVNKITPFSVSDFDKDGIDEIYLNINNSFSHIPKKLKKKGVTSKQIVIEFEKNTLVVKNFKKRKG